MNEEEKRNHKLQYTVPHYYRKFRCTAEACPDTCCAGWQIQIDPASMKKYRRTKGRLGSRLKNEIDWENRCFRQYNGRCAFLNDENLCDLYLEGGGEKAFCRTCRLYPRHIEEFEGLREISLSLSCPSAAELILKSRDPLHFLHAKIPSRTESYQDFDFFLFTKLMDSRNLIFRILQDRSHPFRLRAAIILAFVHDLQQRIDHHALFDTDNLMVRYSSPSVWTWFEQRLKKAGQNVILAVRTVGNLFVILDHLEVLRPDWKPLTREAREILSDAPVPSDDIYNSFRRLFSDITSEQLMAYFIYTYFCGAVYNGNAYGKMKFALAGLVLIREFVRAEWLKTRGDISFDYVVSTACRYSREIEHSDTNKIKMEKMLESNERFGLETLFSIL